MTPLTRLLGRGLTPNQHTLPVRIRCDGWKARDPNYFNHRVSFSLTMVSRNWLTQRAIVIAVTRLLTVPAVCILAPLPAHALDDYRFDPVHTQIMFSAGHLGFSNPVGRFLKFDGGFSFDAQALERSSVTITIQSASLEMGDARWNKALRGKQYFNVDTHSTIHFISTAINPTDSNSASVDGNLTLLGVTKPITVDMRVNRVGIHPLTGKKTAGFSGTAKLKRSDFGMTSALSMVGDEVNITLEVEGILDIQEPKPFQTR
ncbi:MAG: YceI family protein [Gammaproteobacteria bacterium]|nr:YceI family protein [Gammaproteobacteria bacterium]